MLVAHPDDEIIFGGQLLLSTPDVRWEILSVTHGTDERGDRFQSAARVLAEYGVGVDIQACLGRRDEGPILGMADYLDWREVVLSATRGQVYDIVVTHNRLGEYGHGHHMAVHSIAQDIWGDDVWNFYATGHSSIGPQEKLGAGFRLEITPAKTELMERIYPEETFALWRNQPEMMEAQFSGLEQYTSAGRNWPL